MYRAPVEEIAHVLKHVAGLGKAIEEERFGDLSEDLVDAILAEAGRFASEEIAPINEIGDREGAALKAAHQQQKAWTMTRAPLAAADIMLTRINGRDEGEVTT